MKKLYRDPSNQMISGVCSGVAKYLNVDPTIVRLLWAIAVFFAGTGVLLYIICALIIPEEPVGYYDNFENQFNQQNQQNENTTYYDPNHYQE